LECCDELVRLNMDIAMKFIKIIEREFGVEYKIRTTIVIRRDLYTCMRQSIRILERQDVGSNMGFFY
jgi:hypothetical protein